MSRSNKCSASIDLILVLSFFFPTGNWSINSGNVDHLNAGVTAIYTVECCGECPNKPFDFKANPPLREYFLCINEVEWDYSPGTINGFTGHDYSQPGT